MNAVLVVLALVGTAFGVVSGVLNVGWGGPWAAPFAKALGTVWLWVLLPWLATLTAPRPRAVLVRSLAFIGPAVVGYYVAQSLAPTLPGTFPVSGDPIAATAVYLAWAVLLPAVLAGITAARRRWVAGTPLLLAVVPAVVALDAWHVHEQNVPGSSASTDSELLRVSAYMTYVSAGIAVVAGVLGFLLVVRQRRALATQQPLAVPGPGAGDPGWW